MENDSERFVSDNLFNLWMLLGYTRRVIYNARDKELAKYGISTEQAHVLLVIKMIGEKATPAEIARWVVLQPHTVSGMLSRMERKGLISKIKDLERRNLTRIALTKKGEKALEDSAKRESIKDIFSSLAEEEQHQMWNILKKLRESAIQQLDLPFTPLFFPPLR